MRRSQGHTLIELLCIISVVAILAAIILPAIARISATGPDRIRNWNTFNQHRILIFCIDEGDPGAGSPWGEIHDPKSLESMQRGYLTLFQ